MTSCNNNKVDAAADFSVDSRHLPTSMDDLSSSTASSITSGAYLQIQKGGGSKRMPKVFDFHSGRKCPTCEGTGKVPKDREDELVALIPYSDKRLKPKKPWLPVLVVVLIVIIFAIIAGTILGVFMYPRDVTISLTNLTEINNFVRYKRHGKNLSNITIELMTSLAITNKNYFSIQIDSITSELDYFDLIVSNVTFNNFTAVPSSTYRKYSVTQNATFHDVKAHRLLAICVADSFKGNIHLDISVSMSYTYLSHQSTIMNTFSNYFMCSIILPIHNTTDVSPAMDYKDLT